MNHDAINPWLPSTTMMLGFLVINDVILLDWWPKHCSLSIKFLISVFYSNHSS